MGTNLKCAKRIRMHTLAKAILITFPPKKCSKLEREIAIRSRLLRFALEMQDDVDVEIVIE